MGDPYTDVTVTNYNLNPPPDDGSNTPDNEVTWAKHKDKIGDPLKTAIESVNTNVGSAVDKLAGGITSVGTNYTVLAGDQGKLVRATAAITITTPSASVVGSPFVFYVLNNSAGTVTVDGSGSETVDGEETVTLPAGSGALFSTDGTNWFTGGRGNIQGAQSFVVPLPRGYLSGLQISNSSTDGDHDIDIAAGVARDSSDSFNFINSSPFTKRIDASWVAGTGNGGLASGVSLTADTTYHVFVVDDGSGNTDAGFDTSVTATNLLSDTGGSFFRRIGSIVTDSVANILAFHQQGDEFLWETPIVSASDVAGSSSGATQALDVPTGIVVNALLNATINRSGGTSIALYITPLVVTNQSATQPNDTSTARISAGIFVQGINGTAEGGEVVVRTNTSAQVRTRVSTDTVPYGILTRGWVDTRGRDA